VAVKLFLTSGTERIVETADSAHSDDAFFVVTRRDTGTGRVDTLLTLRSSDVVGAEVLKDGVRTAYIPGRGQRSK